MFFLRPPRYTWALLLACTSALHAATYPLQPVADTYVRNSSTTTNYESDTNLIANNANGIRVSFLRFDLRGITGPITTARLDLTVSLASVGQDFHVYGLKNGENWSESSLTWNNAPAIGTSYTAVTGTLADYLKTSDLYGNGTVLGSFTSQPALDTAFLATSGETLDFLNADADGIVTFVIAEPGAADIGGVGWKSREATSGRPTLTVTTGPLPKFIRVVLMGGQSNADGRADGSGLPTSPVNFQAPLPNVTTYNYTYGAAANSDGTLGVLGTLRPGMTQMPTGGFGPEIGMGHALASVFEQQDGTALAIIKYAKGGSTLLSDWKADGTASSTNDGTHYKTWQQVVNNGLAKLQAAYPTAKVKVAGMLWVQGESDIDAGSAAVSAYAANLTTFIADVRATLGTPVPFFFSRISKNQTVYSNPSDPDYQNHLTLRAQQQQVVSSVPSAFMIDTDPSGFTMNSDSLHFNVGGQLALGRAFAAAMADKLMLRITKIQPETGSVQLEWNGLPGKSYGVSTSSDLIEWSSQSVGFVSSWTAPRNGGRAFYRIFEEN